MRIRFGWLEMMSRRIPFLAFIAMGGAASTLALTPPSTLSEEDKQALLDLHNEMRSQVAAGALAGQPGASDMEHLLWDDGLAAVATDYASMCIWAHNSNREADLLVNASRSRIDLSNWTYRDVGENIFATTVASPTIQTLLGGVDLWFDENGDYTFGTVQGTESCTPGEQCGHYTQIVWANTRFLGCGFSTCSGLVGWPQGRTFLVCNYSPAGNFIGEAPYAPSGAPCSACSADRASACSDSLCSGCDFADPLGCVEVPVPEPTFSLQMLVALVTVACLRVGRRVGPARTRI